MGNRLLRAFFLLAVSLPLASQAGDKPATQPTDTIRAWENLKYGMFIHFGLSTFSGNEFGRVPAESKQYAPSQLDVDQWIRTAKKSGMNYAVLTVKHHYGHALWPSKYSDYTVATSSNTTDVVKLFVEACRKHGVKPGFYYSLGWDSHHQTRMQPEEYERFVLNQMTELLTDYGPVTELWCDIPWDLGPQMRDVLDRLYTHCKRLQPDCLILHNQGFVDGQQVEYREPTYFGKSVGETSVPIWPKDLNNGERVMPPSTGHDPLVSFDGTTYYIPNEVCDSLGQKRWFWGELDDVRPARQMVELYRRSVGRGSNLLLNVGPDRSGRIPPEVVRRLEEIATLIEHPDQVQDSLLIGCVATASNVYHNDTDHWGPEHAIDMDITARAGTRWATDDAERSAWLEVDLGGQKVLGRATISEFLDSIRRFEIQVPDGSGGWKAVHRGKTIGGAGVDITFEPVTADRVRLAITEATLGPTIWDFAIYPPKSVTSTSLSERPIE